MAFSVTKIQKKMEIFLRSDFNEGQDVPRSGYYIRYQQISAEGSSGCIINIPADEDHSEAQWIEVSLSQSGKGLTWDWDRMIGD